MRPPDFPKGSMEDRIVNYFKAFNSGDESLMREFINENASAESLKRRSVDEQIGFYKRLRDEMKNVKVTRFLRAGDAEIKVLADTESGETVSFDFRFEPQAPHKIEGMRIGKVMGSEPLDEPLPPNERPAPLTEKEFSAETDKILDNAQKQDDFSGVVLIAQKDKVVYTKAVGLANKDWIELIRSRTPYACWLSTPKEQPLNRGKFLVSIALIFVASRRKHVACPPFDLCIA